MSSVQQPAPCGRAHCLGNRIATHIIAMKQGHIVAGGNPREVIGSEVVEHVFGLPNVLIEDPVTGSPLIVPLDAGTPREPVNVTVLLR